MVVEPEIYIYNIAMPIKQHFFLLNPITPSKPPSPLIMYVLGCQPRGHEKLQYLIYTHHSST